MHGEAPPLRNKRAMLIGRAQKSGRRHNLPSNYEMVW